MRRCDSCVHHLPQNPLRLGQGAALLDGQGRESALQPLITTTTGLVDVRCTFLREFYYYAAPITRMGRPVDVSVVLEILQRAGHRRWSHMLTLSVLTDTPRSVSEQELEHRELPLRERPTGFHPEPAADPQQRHPEPGGQGLVLTRTGRSRLRNHTQPL